MGFKAELSGRTGLNIATGAEACKAALQCFKAKKVTVITPYQDIGDKNVVKFFSEIGFEVVRIHGLKCGSATDIAHVPEEWCEKVIKEEFNIPIIPINVACLWFGMREAGIDTKLNGCTRLF